MKNSPPPLRRQSPVGWRTRVTSLNLSFWFAVSCIALSAGLPAAIAAPDADSPQAHGRPGNVDDPGQGHGQASGQGKNAGSQAGQQKDEDTLIEAAPIEYPEWVQDNFDRRSAATDGWRSEVLHSNAKKPVKALLAYFLDSDHVDVPKKSLADGFHTLTPLRPAKMQEVFSDGVTSAWRPAEIPPQKMSMSQISTLAKSVKAPFGDSHHVHPFFKFVRIKMVGPNRFRGDMLLHLSDKTDSGILQANSEWTTYWQIGETDEDLKLESIELTFYEEIRTRKALFGEITTHVFGANAFWFNEFLRGVDDYHNKMDRLIGQSFIGSQGFAIGDVNGDGLDDLYVTQQGGLPNRLFLRSPNGTARDASSRSNLDILENTRSALIIDLDNDGDQDLAASIGANILVAYNDGKGVFGEFTRLKGTGFEDIYSLSAGDPDNDGDLDFYACRYVANGIMGGVPTPYHDANNGASNFYWRNDGVGQFTDATAEVGLDQNNVKFSLVSIWEDFDDDGDVDLYVANDFGTNNLYRNDGGKFTDIAMEAGAEDMAAGMGLSTADFDLDGDMDLLITNMFSSAGQRIVPQTDLFMKGEHQEVHQHYGRHARGNTLLSNNGDGTFTDVTMAAGISVGGWSWGSKFVDFNNDGYADIYAPNGFITGPDTDDL